MNLRIILLFVFVLAVTLAIHHYVVAKNAARQHVDRCAVIGGMTMTGLWPELAKMFEAESGYNVEVAVTGPRPVLDQAMRAGKVDLLTMHSGDITTALLADGYAPHMRPWPRNELCIL